MGRPQTINRDSVWELHDRKHPASVIANMLNTTGRSVNRILREPRPGPGPTPQPAPETTTPQLAVVDGAPGLPLDPMVAATRVANGEPQALITQSSDPERALRYLKDLAMAAKNTAEAKAKRPPDGVPPQVVGDVLNHVVQIFDNLGRAQFGYDAWLDFFGDVVKPELDLALKDEWPELDRILAGLEDDDDVG